MTETEKKPKIQHQADGRKDLYMFHPDKLQIEEGWNARNETESYLQGIRTLADSIKSEGVKESLTVYLRKPDNDVIITNGHRRFAAVKLAMSEGAEIKSIPCRVEERTANEADRTLSMITRNSGVPLTFLEQSSVIKRLVNFGWTQKEISTRTAMTVPHVGNMIVLSAAPVRIHEMITSEQISATLAVDMIKEHGEEKAVEILEGAITSATDAGRKKATRKNVSGGIRVKWSKVGKSAVDLLDEILSRTSPGVENSLSIDHETAEKIREIISMVKGGDKDET